VILRSLIQISARKPAPLTVFHYLRKFFQAGHILFRLASTFCWESNVHSPLMETESQLSCLQQQDTGSFPEPKESISFPSLTQLYKVTLISSHLYLRLPIKLSLQNRKQSHWSRIFLCYKLFMKILLLVSIYVYLFYAILTWRKWNGRMNGNNSTDAWP
jgi:hypothetical protein